MAMVSVLSLSSVEVPWRVDILDLVRRDPGVLEGPPHDADRPVAVGGRGGDVERVARHPVADHLGVDPGVALQGPAELLQDEDARPFAHDEPVALGVERAGGRTDRRSFPRGP